MTSPYNANPKPPRKLLSLLLRLTASVVVLVALLWFVRNENLLDRLLAMQPGWLMASALCLVMVFVCNSLRWQILLRGYQIGSRFGEALLLYTVAHFFTLFLPGSVGSDAIRTYYVAHRHGRTAAVVLATLQERLAGLGALLALGLVGTAALRLTLGSTLASTLALVQLGTLALVVLALFPGFIFTFSRYLWGRSLAWPALSGITSSKFIARVARFLAPASEPLRLSRRQLALLALALAGSTLFGVGTYWSLALAAGVQISWLGMALASSVVTLSRTLPISLNGIGVGEGAFVVMLAPFAVAPADALAISLAGLVLHSIAALIGGLCYAIMLGKGIYPNARPEAAP